MVPGILRLSKDVSPRRLSWSHVSDGPNVVRLLDRWSSLGTIAWFDRLTMPDESPCGEKGRNTQTRPPQMPPKLEA